MNCISWLSREWEEILTVGSCVKLWKGGIVFIALSAWPSTLTTRKIFKILPSVCLRPLLPLKVFFVWFFLCFPIMSNFSQVLSILLLKIAIGLSNLKMKKIEAHFHSFVAIVFSTESFVSLSLKLRTAYICDYITINNSQLAYFLFHQDRKCFHWVFTYWAHTREHKNVHTITRGSFNTS